MMTCSATEVTLLPDTSMTVILRSFAASRSTWSDPTPAVMQSFRLLAFSMTSRVAYPGWKGVLEGLLSWAAWS